MKRKLQVVLNEEAWNLLDEMTKQANDNFKNGHVTSADIINEIVCNAKIDIRLLQAKCTNLRKSLRILASQKELDIDAAIKNLMEIKARTTKKNNRTSSGGEAASS